MHDTATVTPSEADSNTSTQGSTNGKQHQISVTTCRRTIRASPGRSVVPIDVCWTLSSPNPEKASVNHPLPFSNPYPLFSIGPHWRSANVRRPPTAIHHWLPTQRIWYRQSQTPSPFPYKTAGDSSKTALGKRYAVTKPECVCLCIDASAASSTS